MKPVPSRTISLEESAYHALKAAKQPGESFSRVVLRLLEEHRPRLASLSGLLAERDAAAVRATVSRLRREDLSSQRSPPGPAGARAGAGGGAESRPAGGGD